MLRGAGGAGPTWREREAAKNAAGGGAAAPSAPAAAPAAATDNDGFTEVKKSVYRPPGARH
jgi:translation initiation factor 3 subunit A